MKGILLKEVCIQACLNFVKSGNNKTAIIASLDNAKEAFKEKAGTIIK